jgi:CubicO group peptidase (beta-lactamase class C family)
VYREFIVGIKKLGLVVLAVATLFCLGLLITGNGYLFAAVSRTYLEGYDTANINDHRVFENRSIEASLAQPWPVHPNYIADDLPRQLVEYLGQYQTAAFLVIHQGQILGEQYFLDYNESSITNSFSMAKTVLTLLLGIAIDDGLINGLDQKIVEFLPEFKDDEYGSAATVGSLSSMTSGYDWNEDYYSPFSPTVELLYGRDVTEFVLGGHFSKPPGSEYYYSSAGTQLLAILITRAIKQNNPDANLSSYLSEKLWQPLGMNSDGLWHLDSNGMELAFCCLNSNARNYAKFGQLMLQDGRWRGEQLVPLAHIDLMRTPQKVDHYGYSNWINETNEPPFYSFNGHLGQYIIVVPDHELIIVRLGEIRQPQQRAMRTELPFYIEQVLPLLGET